MSGRLRFVAGSLALMIVLGCGGKGADKLVGFFAPNVAAMTPSFGAEGSQVTLFGENLQGEATSPLKVTFGGVNATIITRANDRLVVVVPAGAPATSNVLIVTNYGSDSTPLAFVVGTPTVVAEVEPNNALASATMTGRNQKMSGSLSTGDLDYFTVSGLSGLLRYRVSTGLPGARLTVNGEPVVVGGDGIAEIDGRVLWTDGEPVTFGLSNAVGSYQLEIEAVL